MKREIKFRYRYTDGKSWIFQSFTLEQIINGEPFEVLSDNPMLKNYKYDGEDQYTRLKDKEGTELYEGDIVQCFRSGKKSKFDIYFIKYEYNSFFMAQEKSDTKMDSIWFYEFKVIGNIYQHPHLIKQ